MDIGFNDLNWATAFACIAAIAAAVSAWLQWTTSKKQQKIALYDIRYKYLYKPLQAVINESDIILSMRPINHDKLAEILKDNFEKFHYASFSIKETDYKKINTLLTDCQDYLINFANKYITLPGHDLSEEKEQQRYKDLAYKQEYIQNFHNDIKKIITPYLQIS